MNYLQRKVHFLKATQNQQLCHFQIQDVATLYDEHWLQQLQ